MKKHKSILIKTLLSISFIFLLIFIISKSNILKGNIIVNDKPNFANTKDLVLKLPQNSTSFNDMPINKLNSVKISILNKPLDSYIFEKAQRYYINLDNLCELLNINYSSNNENILIGDNIKLTPSSNIADVNNSKYSLRGNLLFIDSKYYISLSDIEYLFNLRTHFNFEDNSINLVNGPKIEKVKNTNSSGRIALVRLEDFSAGSSLADAINIEKMKILGDLLYSKNIAFHIAWVPRYENPIKNIDNNLLTNNSIKNVAFINLMDHLINRGALIGLHGYTHQFDDETSLSGTELSRTANSSTEATINVIENSLNNSIALNIPIGFFESPHYKATRKQLEIAEEYFKYLYEPYSPIEYFNIKHTKSNNIYIPTPLSYVRNLDPSNIIANLNSPKAGALMSFFYHPGKEYSFIDVTYTNTNLEYTYSSNSPMQQIIQALNNNGYVTSYITEIK